MILQVAKGKFAAASRFHPGIQVGYHKSIYILYIYVARSMMNAPKQHVKNKEHIYDPLFYLRLVLRRAFHNFNLLVFCCVVVVVVGWPRDRLVTLLQLLL